MLLRLGHTDPVPSGCGRDHAARRQLLGLPGLFRPAVGHGDRLGTGDQRGVRVHLHADQPAEGPSSRPHRGDLRSARADLSPRHDPGLQGRPGGGARHPPSADGPGPPGGRRPAHPDRREGGFRSRRPHRHPHPGGEGPRRRRHHRDRRPRRLPAGGRSPRQGALQPAGRVGLRPLRRGRYRAAHRCPAGPLSPVRRPQGGPLGQSPGRTGRGGEDCGQAAQHLRRPGRRLLPPRGAVAPAPRQPRRRRGDGSAQRQGHAAPFRRPRRGRSRRADHGGVGFRGDPPPVQLPRVPHPVGPSARRARERSRRRPPPTPRRAPSWRWRSPPSRAPTPRWSCCRVGRRPAAPWRWPRPGRDEKAARPSRAWRSSSCPSWPTPPPKSTGWAPISSRTRACATPWRPSSATGEST